MQKQPAEKAPMRKQGVKAGKGGGLFARLRRYFAKPNEPEVDEGAVLRRSPIRYLDVDPTTMRIRSRAGGR